MPQWHRSTQLTWHRSTQLTSLLITLRGTGHLGPASRAWPTHMGGRLISRPGATVLNCISFPSFSNEGFFLRRESCLLPVAELTVRSACFTFDIGTYFVQEAATISYSLCHFTPQVSLKLQLCCGLLQTYWKWASAQDGFKAIFSI